MGGQRGGSDRGWAVLYCSQNSSVGARLCRPFPQGGPQRRCFATRLANRGGLARGKYSQGVDKFGGRPSFTAWAGSNKTSEKKKKKKKKGEKKKKKKKNLGPGPRFVAGKKVGAGGGRGGEKKHKAPVIGPSATGVARGCRETGETCYTPRAGRTGQEKPGPAAPGARAGSVYSSNPVPPPISFFAVADPKSFGIVRGGGRRPRNPDFAICWERAFGLAFLIFSARTGGGGSVGGGAWGSVWVVEWVFGQKTVVSFDVFKFAKPMFDFFPQWGAGFYRLPSGGRRYPSAGWFFVWDCDFLLDRTRGRGGGSGKKNKGVGGKKPPMRAGPFFRAAKGAIPGRCRRLRGRLGAGRAVGSTNPPL